MFVKLLNKIGFYTKKQYFEVIKIAKENYKENIKLKDEIEFLHNELKDRELGIEILCKELAKEG